MNVFEFVISHRIEELRWAIIKLMELARHFKAKRTEEGAVILEGSEVKVEMQEERIKNVIPKKV